MSFDDLDRRIVAALVDDARATYAVLTRAGKALKSLARDAVPGFSLRANVEAEAAFGRMGVDRQRMPQNLVGAGWQGPEPDTHYIRWTDPGLAHVDPPAARILHLHGAEGRLEVLGKPQRELARRGRNRAANSRFGMIEKGVGPGDFGRDQDEQCR